jgi:hypothetical protein
MESRVGPKFIKSGLIPPLCNRVLSSVISYICIHNHDVVRFLQRRLQQRTCTLLHPLAMTQVAMYSIRTRNRTRLRSPTSSLPVLHPTRFHLLHFQNILHLSNFYFRLLGHTNDTEMQMAHLKAMNRPRRSCMCRFVDTRDNSHCPSPVPALLVHLLTEKSRLAVYVVS